MTGSRPLCIIKIYSSCFLRAHWIYRHKLEEMRERMGVPIIFKIGVETFDYDFRQRVLNKHADFREPGEVAGIFRLAMSYGGDPGPDKGHDPV